MKAKTKLTRLWCFLLALVMVAGLLPTTVLAEGAATEKADFSTDPTGALTLINAAKTGEADSTWDGSTNTLTLNGVNFTTTASSAVKLPEASTIVLNGDNTITGGEAKSKDSFGIYALGDLTIEGTGTLTATCGAANDDSSGIYARGNISIAGNVTAIGGAATDKSYGIQAEGSVIVSGTVNAAGGAGVYSHGITGHDSVGISGTVTATGGAAYAGSYGIRSWNYASISGTVNATGGAVSCTASADYYPSAGITVTADLFFSDAAQVTATGGTITASDNAVHALSCGIEVGNDVTFSGTSRVTAAGGTITTADGGVYEGSISYDGSLGILANHNMIVSESAQVTTTGRDGSVYCINGSVSTAGHTIAFDAGGGTGYMEAATGGSIAYILPANSFTAPDGKPFNCWGVNGAELAAGAAIDIAADTTVTAVWAYTVSFDANGGSGEMAAVPGVLGEYTLPENGFTAPEGKYFKAWSVDGAEQAVGAVINVAANTAVTAVWENITYTVSFDPNGGSGEMAAITGVLGEYTLPESGFTPPEGQQFLGWATSTDGAVISDATMDVSADTTLYPVWENIPVVYEILDGANSSWTLDSGESLSIRGSGAFSQFVGVKVDGAIVDATNYTVMEGSTIVTLNTDYLNTLTVGSHTIEIEWTDGSVSTTFTVHAAAAAENDAQSSQSSGSRLWIWIVLIVVLGAGGLGIVLFYKKKKNKVEQSSHFHRSFPSLR